MKKLFILCFLLFALCSLLFAQNTDVYAEYYSIATEQSYLTDNFQMTLYDNAIALDTVTNTNIATAGFQVKLIYICYNDSLRRLYNNNFWQGDEGIVRIKTWDSKLYGYCYVSGLDGTADRVIVTLIGMKNVPQRKKLLFKDSPRLRMWRFNWAGE